MSEQRTVEDFKHAARMQMNPPSPALSCHIGPRMTHKRSNKKAQSSKRTLQVVDTMEAEMEGWSKHPRTESITDEFTNDLWDSYFQKIMSGDDNGESALMETNFDDFALLHDCMWSGTCNAQNHQMLYEEGTRLSTLSDFKPFDGVDLFPSESFGLDLMDLENDISSLTGTFQSDHSYSFNDVGPVQQYPSASGSQQQKQKSQPVAASSRKRSLPAGSRSSSAKRAIQGIVINEEVSDESSTKKTKILVPLKDLMETLQQKSFMVTPFGPGKKVIRLTGNGETVQGVLDFGGSQFQSSTLSSLAAASSSQASASNCFLAPSGGGESGPPRRPAPKKMKKSVHKPKQELSPVRDSMSSQCSQNVSTSSSNSSSKTDNVKPKKTKSHNNMERIRRVDLRNSFESLRRLVPDIVKSSKCSKVEILRKAQAYIDTVRSIEKRLLRDEYNLKLQNETLKERAAYLASH